MVMNVYYVYYVRKGLLMYSFFDVRNGGLLLRLWKFSLVLWIEMGLLLNYPRSMQKKLPLWVGSGGRGWGGGRFDQSIRANL